MNLVELWTAARDARTHYLDLAQRSVAGDAVSPAELTAAAAEAARTEHAARVQQSREAWVTWTVPQIEHVTGRWTHRVYDPDTHMPEPQKVEMTCAQCGQSWQTTCASGNVRAHIQRFAVLHLHRDVFGYVPRKLDD